MISAVLVPLDRSPTGEQALSPAVAIARRAQAQLHVLHVRPMAPPIGSEDGDPVAEAALDEETDYLEKVEQRIRNVTGLTPVVETREGSVPDVIRRYAANVGADFIVMTTHGRTGPSRAWLGSVADAVVRQDSIPVLMVRPDEHPVALDEHPLFSHVLVPLDGSSTAEIVLEEAASIGSLAHARYTLLRIVAPAPVAAQSHALAGSATAPSEDAPSGELQEARGYLDAQAARLAETGLRVDTAVRVGAHPALSILATAREVNADLIAMCTHRHSGSRFMLGSVADKVLRGGELPVLMMHPHPTGR